MDPRSRKMDNDALRTVLANERTMLAYVRTALSAIIFGLVVLKFFYDSRLFAVLSWAAIIAGVFVFCWGLVEYGVRDRAIRKVNE